MAFCTNCGTQFNDKQEFCTNCGALLKPKVSNKTPKSEDSSELKDKANTNVPHSPMSKGTKIIILLILLIGIVLGIVTIVGKTYKTVKIGKQTWMAKNLNIEIGNSKCYDNDPANCKKYGRLYDWETAMKACPKGWHLPSNEEFEVLDEVVGAKNLKATSGWKENGNGEDKFGFSALPGGIGYSESDGIFEHIGYNGYWWSATESNANKAYVWYIDDDNEIVHRDYGSKGDLLLSVRCVQDNRNGDNDNTIETNTIETNTIEKPNKKVHPKDYEQYKEQINELEREAEKWIKNGGSFKEKQGEYFSFSCGAVNPCTDCGSGENKWTATSEVEIGDCPAGSVWIMVRWAHEGGTGGNNKVPPECKSITPIIITDFNFSEDYN